MIAPFLNTKGIALAMAELGLAGELAARPLPRVVAGAAFSQAPAFEVAEYSLEQLDLARAEWLDLAARAIEPNGFYEPGFALSAARHFPLSSRPRFIVVRDQARRFAGLFPIVPANALTGDGLIRLWLHKQATLATPLVERDQAKQAIKAFLDWIESRSLAAGVVFARTTTKGPFHAALAEVAAENARRLNILESFERAALLPGGHVDEAFARAGSKKKLSNILRVRRRLGELGRVSFDVVEAPDDVRNATEEFLALEASGWKAGRGAFLSQPSLVTFLRAATRELAQERRCKISALRLDGRPIAMAILIESQNRSYCWKIAFDESLRSYAPGVQLIYEQTKAQLARPGLEITDSCAIPDHPLIDRMWPDRIGVCDVAVQLQTGRERDFASSCRRDGARRQIRDLAKRAANHLLKRKVS